MLHIDRNKHNRMRYAHTKIIKILELPNMEDKINVYVLTELEVTLIETLRIRL